jgi:hypothetical protein
LHVNPRGWRLSLGKALCGFVCRPQSLPEPCGAFFLGALPALFALGNAPDVIQSRGRIIAANWWRYWRRRYWRLKER